ncbi:hypothetical protein [Janthinobacterium aquaticum]|uniref:hypothetical protein n=1 Tax=Janthinobacterium sp. FT58W TaxID=2654254 RepID=UPI001264AF09|nr:hypothetical protein [Janthinobacterium sp. FT58W]KAB8042172.1 hypothetical protein GCM43_13900 [Janthinobacterium sp. FT58W]
MQKTRSEKAAGLWREIISEHYVLEIVSSSKKVKDADMPGIVSLRRHKIIRKTSRKRQRSRRLPAA